MTIDFRKVFGSLAIAAVAAVPAAASAQQWWNPATYGYGNGGNYYGGNREFSGTVNAVNSGSLQVNGRTVFLKSGTVINPRGVNLQPGESVSVIGSDAGNGAINASEVDISTNGYNNGGYNNGGYNNGGYYNNGNNGYYNSYPNNGSYNNGGYYNGQYHDRGWWEQHRQYENDKHAAQQQRWRDRHDDNNNNNNDDHRRWHDDRDQH